MGLSYVYIILRSKEDYLDSDTIEWAGVRKWEATKFLESKLTEGDSLARFQVIRMKENQPSSMSYVDVYEFMNIDLGEQF